ncbi:MAG: cupin domain-containing protein [Mediterranea sp.]|jgi:uncharacterized cupin superfamily protein|nr:cupin domain-containing protein [Mediterranea sp.]
MATILRSAEREFKDVPNRMEHFRLLTDISNVKKGIKPQYLNFDLHQLDPGQYCPAYHFHRYAEELFMILSGSTTLRTPNGLEVVNSGDLIFFESGETGAHQLYNHTTEPCVYLDIRTSIGYDVCEYPDSNKIYLSPSGEIFNKDAKAGYFDGEDKVEEVWKGL